MSLSDYISDGIIKALTKIGVTLLNWTTAFLDQFLLFILVFIILANVMGFKGFNKFANLAILIWLIMKVITV